MACDILTENPIWLARRGIIAHRHFPFFGQYGLKRHGVIEWRILPCWRAAAASWRGLRAFGGLRASALSAPCTGSASPSVRRINSAWAFLEGEHLPPLRAVAVLGANCCRDERLACLRGALFRLSKERAQWHHRFRHSGGSCAQGTTGTESL
jgi:hypothetical protein